MLCEHLDLWIIIVFEDTVSGSAYLTHRLTFELPKTHNQQQNVEEKQRNEHRRD